MDEAEPPPPPIMAPRRRTRLRPRRIGRDELEKRIKAAQVSGDDPMVCYRCTAEEYEEGESPKCYNQLYKIVRRTRSGEHEADVVVLCDACSRITAWTERLTQC
jgi:hypothetical protein